MLSSALSRAPADDARLPAAHTDSPVRQGTAQGAGLLQRCVQAHLGLYPDPGHPQEQRGTHIGECAEHRLGVRHGGDLQAVQQILVVRKPTIGGMGIRQVGHRPIVEPERAHFFGDAGVLDEVGVGQFHALGWARGP